MTMIDTPEGIAFAQMAARAGALRLELQGMHRRGRSAYSICKSEYGLRGNRASVSRQMDAMVEAILADRATQRLIDWEDQGVCPDGHPCEVFRAPDGPDPFLRVCDTSHPDLGDSRYYGLPLIADITYARVEELEKQGADPRLCSWAYSAVLDRSTDEPHEHTVDHNLCDRDDHLRRRETGEDCPMRGCLECGYRVM